MRNNLLKHVAFMMLFSFISFKGVIAQLPNCSGSRGYVYLHVGREIYNWDPLLPISSANPSLNTITLPVGSNGLAVSRNLNDPTAPSPTFYTVVNGYYYYYDGTNWVNTGHTVPVNAVNIGAGGGYMYAMEPSGIYKYDGTGNATYLIPASFLSSNGAYDIVADNQGNFYTLETRSPQQRLRKYDPNGNVLKEWKLIGAPSFGASGSLAIICDRLYYYDSGPKLGIIGDSTVTVSVLPGYGYLPRAGDFASCEVGEGVLSGGNDTTISVVRGCKSAFINFHRPAADGTPYLFKLLISGTADNGYDYQHIDTVFYIPANQTDASLEIKPLLISNPSGIKEAIIEVWGKSCIAGGAEGVVRTITVQIQDSLAVKITTPPDTVCPGTEITIAAEIDSTLDFKWAPADQIPDAGQLVIHPRPDTTTVYSITVTQPGAPATCPPRTAYYQAAVEPVPQITAPGDTTICLSDSMDLLVTAKPEGINFTYNWSPASFLRNDFAPNNKFYAPVGKYKKVITVANRGGCQAKDSFIINVIPPFTFEKVTPDTTIKYGDQIRLYSESDAVSWFWDPARYLDDPWSASTGARPLENMVYTLTGYDKYGCRNTAIVKVNISYTSNVFVPSAFSPNGDGLNDVFKPENVVFEKLISFQIFDRWGKLIFESHDPLKGWDGTYSGKPAGTGVYFFNIQLSDPFGRPINFKGDLSLIR